MKLDRNINSNGRNKYALLLLRELDARMIEFKDGTLSDEIRDAVELLERFGIVDWGNRGTDSEFFVMRLKDEYSKPALEAYRDAAHNDDPEYAAEIDDMACRAGHNSVWHKKPD